jgi:hypothetical protein
LIRDSNIPILRFAAWVAHSFKGQIALCFSEEDAAFEVAPAENRPKNVENRPVTASGGTLCYYRPRAMGGILGA